GKATAVGGELQALGIGAYARRHGQRLDLLPRDQVPQVDVFIIVDRQEAVVGVEVELPEPGLDFEVDDRFPGTRLPDANAVKVGRLFPSHFFVLIERTRDQGSVPRNGAGHNAAGLAGTFEAYRLLQGGEAHHARI